MAKIAYITGIPQVLAKMTMVDKKVEAGLARGLKKGGLFLQRNSQKIVPIKTTHLKGSAFTRNMGGSGKDTDIVVGYTAEYAVYVHEIIENKHKPGKEAKYLEKPAREFRKQILEIIRDATYNY